MDSVTTAYGYVTSRATSIKTPAPNRFMVGHVDDPVFGKTTATAYTYFWPSTFPIYGANPKLHKLTLTLVLDYYWSGSTEETSKQVFEVYELADSMLTYIPHYPNESQKLGRLLGTGTTSQPINPADFDANILSNKDADVTNDIYDSLTVAIDPDYAIELFKTAMDSVGDNEANYELFYKFRKKFKGFAIKAPNSNKIVGFDLEHSKSRMVLDYTIDTLKYQLIYSFTPSGQAIGTPEYMSYTQLETDRSGTPLAGLTTKYQDFEAPTGLRYVQAGTGITTRLDFSEVFEYFKDIPIKALSVAELRIETDEQKYAPFSFLLRAIKPDNREISTSTQVLDITGDPFAAINTDFVLKHPLATRVDGGYTGPFYRAEILGDDKTVFRLSQASNSGTALYTGYMTNYLQTELGLSEADFLRYFELIPYALDKQTYAPDNSRSVNGFYFSPDKVKLKVYYTTPRAKN